jgi:predicted acyltransferase
LQPHLGTTDGTQRRAERIASIDVFRGLTMLLMLLVNDIGDTDLGHIGGHVPWWLKHLPTEVDGLALPDVIFPTFLFIVGLSIPIALQRRTDRGDSLLEVARHIVGRAACMIFIGLCMVNGCHAVPLNEAAMGISAALWRRQACWASCCGSTAPMVAMAKSSGCKRGGGESSG